MSESESEKVRGTSCLYHKYLTCYTPIHKFISGCSSGMRKLDDSMMYMSQLPETAISIASHNLLMKHVMLHINSSSAKM